MRKIFVLLLSIMALSCSKEKEPDFITIDRQEITLNYGEEKTVIIETNLDNVTAFTEDDYVADAFAGLKSMDVWANKVGKTKIVVKGGTAEAELEVEVLPKEDNIGTPVVALGQDMSYIKSKEDAELLAIGSDYLSYYDNVSYGAYHRYSFKNGKLESIKTTIDISRLSSKYDTYLIEISKSLKERYKVTDSYKGEYRLIYMYQYKQEYFVGIVKGEGNGGWYLCYAKTKEKILECLDKHPSIAI